MAALALSGGCARWWKFAIAGCIFGGRELEG